MNEEFTYLVKQFGKPEHALPLSAELKERLEGRLPNSTLEFWSECGIGTMLDGLLQFCEPSTFENLVANICGTDPDFPKGVVTIFSFTAFGELYGWHSKFGRCSFDLIFGAVTTNIPVSEKEKETHRVLGPDRLIASQLVDLDRFADLKDEDGNRLFARAQKKLGRLEPGECYGFVPARALGGVNRLDHLRRVRAVEHFSILAGLRQFEWFNVADGQEARVRVVGG